LSFLRKSPGIAGSTGVGQITSLGANVGNLSIKDQVLVVSTGVWTDFVTVPVSSVVKIPESLSVEDSAALPAALSAYAILNNFVDLKAGDVVVQYGGNTAVGLAITQIGTASGYKVVNAGQAEISDVGFSKTVAAMGSVKLTITNTSKKAVSKTLMRCLAPKGSLVMYQGDGSNDDSDGVDVPVGSAIFKANSIYGFNFNSWMVADPKGVAKAMAAVSPMVNSKKITFQSKVFPQPEYLKALGEIEATGGSVILKL
jgi:NADPH:quinone reductase-like Zn-dependent oxidoreductase